MTTRLAAFSSQKLTFVTFSSLPGCATCGGYVTVSWSPGNNGVTDENRTKQIVATLLFGKATETPMEVRYRINSAPIGWGWLHDRRRVSELRFVDAEQVRVTRVESANPCLSRKCLEGVIHE
jgi:hypothetical protein